MSTELNTILSWFETGDYPTQEQFQNAWSSFWHKDEKLSMSSITNLEASLQNKVDNSIFNTHLTSENAHATTLAKLDGSNLNYLNAEAWKTALGVGELPSNIALIDDPVNALQGNVWTKVQSHALYMLLEDFVASGKIRADKIEALGLTELISVTETSLSAFMANNANYQYEKNDFIAIPNGSGNYSLYIFKGGSKTVSSNYLPTGLTTITIAMVEGLQTALDNKLDKPTGAGSFIVTRVGTTSGYRQINTASDYLLFWNNTDFMASEIYRNAGKYGIGITTPSEMLHLNNGRIRAKAMVFDENTETLPYQITHSNRRYFGSDLTGTARMFMYRDYADYKALWESLTDAQKTEIKTIANGGWSTGTMSAAMISPPIVDQSKNQPSWITLKGTNLNLNPTSFSVELFNIDTNQYTPVPASQVQLYTTGIDLVFWFNFNTIPAGNYKIRLWNGVANYTTPMILRSLSSLVEFDMTTITWTALKSDNSSTNGSYGNNGFGTIAPGGIMTALRSSIIFTADEDFSLSFKINSQIPISNNGISAGIVSGLIPISTVNNFSIEWRYQDISAWGGAGNVTLNGNLCGSGTTNFTDTVYITRQGTLYTVMVVKGNNTAFYFNITAPAIPISLGLLGNGGNATMTIQQIYSLNQ